MPKTKAKKHSASAPSGTRNNKTAMDKVKIKRVKRNKKKVTTKEKIVAGLGVGSTLLGGAGMASHPKTPQTNIVRTQPTGSKSQKQGIRESLKRLFNMTLGAPPAEAFTNDTTGQTTDQNLRGPDEFANPQAYQRYLSHQTSGVTMDADGNFAPITPNKIMPTGLVDDTKGPTGVVTPSGNPVDPFITNLPASGATASAEQILLTNTVQDVDDFGNPTGTFHPASRQERIDAQAIIDSSKPATPVVITGSTPPPAPTETHAQNFTDDAHPGQHWQNGAWVADAAKGPGSDAALAPQGLETTGLKVAPDANGSLTGYVNINGVSTRLSIIQNADGRIYDVNGKDITDDLVAQGLDVAALRTTFANAPRGTVQGVDPSYAKNNPAAETHDENYTNDSHTGQHWHIDVATRQGSWVNDEVKIPAKGDASPAVPIVDTTGLKVAPDVNKSLTGYVNINGMPTRLSIIQSDNKDGHIYDINGQDITQDLIDQGVDVDALRVAFSGAPHGAVQGLDSGQAATPNEGDVRKVDANGNPDLNGTFNQTFYQGHWVLDNNQIKTVGGKVYITIGGDWVQRDAGLALEGTTVTQGGLNYKVVSGKLVLIDGQHSPTHPGQVTLGGDWVTDTAAPAGGITVGTVTPTKDSSGNTIIKITLSNGQIITHTPGTNNYFDASGAPITDLSTIGVTDVAKFFAAVEAQSVGGGGVSTVAFPSVSERLGILTLTEHLSDGTVVTITQAPDGTITTDLSKLSSDVISEITHHAIAARAAWNLLATSKNPDGSWATDSQLKAARLVFYGIEDVDIYGPNASATLKGTDGKAVTIKTFNDFVGYWNAKYADPKNFDSKTGNYIGPTPAADDLAAYKAVFMTDWKNTNPVISPLAYDPRQPLPPGYSTGVRTTSGLPFAPFPVNLPNTPSWQGFRDNPETFVSPQVRPDGSYDWSWTTHNPETVKQFTYDYDYFNNPNRLYDYAIDKLGMDPYWTNIIQRPAWGFVVPSPGNPGGTTTFVVWVDGAGILNVAPSAVANAGPNTVQGKFTKDGLFKVNADGTLGDMILPASDTRLEGLASYFGGKNPDSTYTGLPTSSTVGVGTVRSQLPLNQQTGGIKNPGNPSNLNNPGTGGNTGDPAPVVVDSPVIRSISVNHGKSGDTITITGTNFNINAVGLNGVQFINSANVPGQTVGATAATATTLTFVVPNIQSGAYTIKAVNAQANQTLSNALPFTVDLASGAIDTTTPAITTTSLAAATVGTAYSQQLTQGNVPGIVTWSISSGTLPAGLQIAGQGLISGIPTTAGTFNFVVQVSSSQAGTTPLTKALSITVGTAAAAVNAPTISSLTPSAATVGQSVNVSLVGTNLTGATLTAPSGSGLTISNVQATATTLTATIAVSSTAPVGGKILTLTTSSGSTTTAFTVNAAAAANVPAITTTTLPNAVVGSAYSQTLAASNFTSAPTWTVTNGSLPAGLQLSSTGVISGTPTAAGSSTFTVRASSGADSDTQDFSLTVTSTASVTISSLNLSKTTANVTRTITTAANGTQAITVASDTVLATVNFSDNTTSHNVTVTVSDSGLTAGVDIQTGNIIISGVPTTANPTVTVHVVGGATSLDKVIAVNFTTQYVNLGQGGGGTTDPTILDLQQQIAALQARINALNNAGTNTYTQQQQAQQLQNLLAQLNSGQGTVHILGNNNQPFQGLQMPPGYPASQGYAPLPQASGFGNDLSARYANVRGTIYDKTTGQGFATAQEFFASAGVSSFDNLIFDTNWKPGAVQGAAIASGTSYTVKKGDTLSGISKKVYGNSSNWRKILAANPNSLRVPGNVKTLKVGFVLNIPQI